MRAILSVRPNGCISLKETPLKLVQILKRTNKNSTEQTSTRMKWLVSLNISQSWLFCEHLLGLQSPQPDTVPWNPRKPQKCILKSEKCHFRPPEKWPQKSIKMSQKSVLGHFNSIDFWGNPLVVLKWYIPDLSGPYRAMRAAMRCEWRHVLNTEKRCDAMQNSGDARSRCGNPLRCDPTMRKH